eukprot:TRINITY_DN10995_c0_g1_i4.p1 TRINITY_DN10995_c0_g1~~TRINITY_DN10995_c0_g1_i4.p1  ORF type:complete len:192 (+),score=69.85 TRINITY_DN10995_c0_g1_i4:196-771(+)
MVAGLWMVLGFFSMQAVAGVQVQEVRVDDLLKLDDMDAIREVYQSAEAKQHARDQALLNSLASHPKAHKCWCSREESSGKYLRSMVKSRAQIQAEEEQHKLDMEMEQVEQARHQAQDQLVREKTEKKKSQVQRRGALLGSSESGEDAGCDQDCEECMRETARLEIQLRAKQMEAEQMARTVQQLRASSVQR